MYQPLAGFLALELTRERREEAERRYRLYRETEFLLPASNPRFAGLRNVTARLLAAVSRGAAWIVRRLDACVADDLGRTLAAAE